MIKRVFLLIAVVYYIFIIFSFSAQTADLSDAGSRKVTQAVYKTVNHVAKKVSPPNGIKEADFMKNFHGLIRKTAHFMNFFILALLVISYARCFEKNAQFCFLFAVLFCLGAAMFDEFHQLFVSGRSGQIRDVLIDTSGAAAGAFFHTLIYERIYLIKKRFSEV